MASAIIAIALILPSSIEFVWSGPLRLGDRWMAPIWRAIENSRISSVATATNRQLVRLGVFRYDTRPLVRFQSLLAASAVVAGALLLALGAVKMWRHGAGSGSIGVDVLWWAVWSLFAAAKIALVAVLLATIHQWLVDRRGTQAPGMGHQSTKMAENK